MNKKIYNEAVEYLRRCYPTILRRCAEKMPRQRGDLTIYDVVHDTTLRILRDPRVVEIKNDEEFVEHFLYRASAVIFKAVHDEKLKHKVYAYYNQATITRQSDDD